VEVVGEERKTEHVASEPPDRLLQSFEQPLAFSLVLENGSPIVATGHQLMDRTGVLDPQGSGHDPRLSHGLVAKTGHGP